MFQSVRGPDKFWEETITICLHLCTSHFLVSFKDSFNKGRLYPQQKLQQTGKNDLILKYDTRKQEQNIS